VTFTREGRTAADLVTYIKSSGINVSLSTPDYSRRDFESHGVAGLVRVSPHAYNTTEEIDRLLVAVASS
jgi:selenocysteine lyase/cysteine desulfurase